MLWAAAQFQPGFEVRLDHAVPQRPFATAARVYSIAPTAVSEETPWTCCNALPSTRSNAATHAPRHTVHVRALQRITIDTEQCGGRPGIRGMHIRVTEALDLLANGLSPEQAVKALPDLETDDIRACLRYASRRFDHPVLLAASSG